MKLSLLFSLLAPTRLQGNPTFDPEIDAVVCDSRKVGPKSIFICVPGLTSDGHAFAKSAYDAGCRVFLVQAPVPLPPDAAVYQTPNTRTALADLAARFYGYPANRLTLIGITGTKGKTTTALMLYRALEHCRFPVAYIGTNGVCYRDHREETVNTTPESLDLQRYLRCFVDQGIRYVILEVSSQALLLERVRGLSFSLCLFTNLSPDHIGLREHPSFENYRDCKHLLFTDYGAQTAIVNADDPHAGYMLKGCSAQTVLTYGMGENADFRGSASVAENRDGQFGIRFFCRAKNGTLPVFLPFAGDYSVYNALAVIAACHALGISAKDAVDALATAHVPGRFELIRFPSLPDVTFVIDYAHNRVSLTSILESLRTYQPKRLICLFGSVGGRTEGRRYEMGKVASELADLCILTSDNPNTEDPEKIIADIAAAFSPQDGCPYVAIPDRADAIRHAVSLARAGDVILLAGKGHERYQLIQNRRVPFSEPDLLRDAVEALCQTPTASVLQ